MEHLVPRINIHIFTIYYLYNKWIKNNIVLIYQGSNLDQGKVYNIMG
jgi:hypothetical protein